MSGRGEAERYVCVHGHFYQPARESPWLGTIETQDSAHPYHDWNERITAECYAPNAAARILGAGERIRRIVNNYARLSFDAGPTLLGWLQRESPAVYAALLEADRRSCRAHAGHGSAVGHTYNHAILPLCEPRDRQTQLAWGLRDFEWRFGRRAEGLWLPETAVDLPTLEALADRGLKFTILAPEQAAAVRGPGETAWRPLAPDELDTTRPYAVPLPSGREIAAFFFHGALARGVAFERLLDHGEDLARRLVLPFDPRARRPQLVHLATDGETFGHHHRFGEMALAFALDRLARGGQAQPIHYAAFLERFPATDQVRIRERTSWSCAHGLDRWSAGCSCGAREGWSQTWRPALRQALDELRRRLALALETHAGGLLSDPWAARDDYIEVLLDGSASSREAFLARHARGAPGPERRVAIWQLLEAQRHALLMFTSCGWFFDDVSRIETVQNLRHAARAVELCRQATGEDLESTLLARLAGAPSNLPEHGDARRVYLEQALPARVDPPLAAAHHAMALLLGRPAVAGSGAALRIRELEWAVARPGGATLGAGRFEVVAAATEERVDLALAVLCRDEMELRAGVGPDPGRAEHAARVAELVAQLERVGPAAAAEHLAAAFPRTFASDALPPELQRDLLQARLAPRRAQAEATLRRLHAEQAADLARLGRLGLPVPAELRAAAEFVVHADLQAACAAEPPDVARLERLLARARQESLALDPARLGPALGRALERLLRDPRAAQGDVALVDRARVLAQAARDLAFEPWAAQNALWALLSAHGQERRRRAREGDPAAAAWVGSMAELAGKLRLAWPDVCAGDDDSLA